MRSFTHLYLYENEWLQQCLSYDLSQMAAFSVFEVRFFHRVFILMVPFSLNSRVWIRVWFLDDAKGNIFLNYLVPQSGFPIQCFTVSEFQSSGLVFWNQGWGQEAWYITKGVFRTYHTSIMEHFNIYSQSPSQMFHRVLKITLYMKSMSHMLF